VRKLTATIFDFFASYAKQIRFSDSAKILVWTILDEFNWLPTFIPTMFRAGLHGVPVCGFQKMEKLSGISSFLFETRKILSFYNF
jgi:hypothetical protein